VPAHQLPHRRVALDAAQQIVFLGAQHGVLLRRSIVIGGLVIGGLVIGGLVSGSLLALLANYLGL
jgi:hypothetical protein